MNGRAKNFPLHVRLKRAPPTRIWRKPRQAMRAADASQPSSNPALSRSSNSLLHVQLDQAKRNRVHDAIKLRRHDDVDPWGLAWVTLRVIRPMFAATHNATDPSPFSESVSWLLFLSCAGGKLLSDDDCNVRRSRVGHKFHTIACVPALCPIYAQDFTVVSQSAFLHRRIGLSVAVHSLCSHHQHREQREPSNMRSQRSAIVDLL
jgi:hypothetical protein